MTENQLHKGGVYIWRKDDPQHRFTLRVTQITRNMVRAVGIEPSAYQRRIGGEPGRSFWNPKSFILTECTPTEGDAMGKTGEQK